MRRTTPESEVLKGCTDLLAAEGIWFERRNTGAMKSEYNGKKRFTRFGKPGVADIFATPRTYLGQFGGTPIRVFSLIPLWIECKANRGKQTDAQKQFQAEVEAAGHEYLVIRSVDELRDWLREHAR